MTTSVSFGADAKSFDFDLRGVVQIAPAMVTPEVVTLYVAMADPKIVSRIPGSQPQFDKVASQMASTGVFFTLSGGRTTEMRAPLGLSATAANAYREIGAALQFSRTIAAIDHYAATEYDTTGQYVVEYAMDGGPNLWHKRKLRYVAILAAKTTAANVPGRIVPGIDESEGTIRLLEDGRPERISSRNVVTVSGAQRPVHSTTSLSLQSMGSTSPQIALPDWPTLQNGMARTAADEPYDVQSTIESLDAARIAGATFEQTVSAFEQLTKEKSGNPRPWTTGRSGDDAEKARRELMAQQESRLFITLAAILREQPDAVSKSIQKIKAKSPASDILIEAMSSAATPVAQRALIELAGSNSIVTVDRDRIAMALARTPRPDTISVEALKKMLVSDPFNEIALLGLGTYSRRLRDAGARDRANAIGTLLVDRLKAAQKTTDRLTTLRAITNSGYAPALADVVAYFSNDDDNVRVAAVRALQSMNDPKVDDVLADRMRSDSSNDVRMSALSAAKIREPSDVLSGAVEDAARSAADPHVRYRAVEVLAAWLPRRPTVRAALEQIAHGDGEPRIRNAAQTAL